MRLANEIAKELANSVVGYMKDPMVLLDDGTAAKIIAAKLEPVREALEKIARGILDCPDSVFEQGEEAVHYWMWSRSQEVAKEALALLSENDGDNKEV